MAQWGGVTKPISSVPLFFELLSTVITHFSFWIIRLSRLYLTGVAAAEAVLAPVKYKCYSNNLRGTFPRSTILLTEILTHRALVTPTTEVYPIFIISAGTVMIKLHTFKNAAFLWLMQFGQRFINNLQLYVSSSNIALLGGYHFVYWTQVLQCINGTEAPGVKHKSKVNIMCCVWIWGGAKTNFLIMGQFWRDFKEF